MEMIPVSSSAITAIGYDAETMRMRVRFTQGHAYDFCRVPAEIFQAFLNSYSKGGFYNDHIRDRYQC